MTFPPLFFTGTSVLRSKYGEPPSLSTVLCSRFLKAFRKRFLSFNLQLLWSGKFFKTLTVDFTGISDNDKGRRIKVVDQRFQPGHLGTGDYAE